MSIIDRTVNINIYIYILFLCSYKVAQYMLYSTNIMVDFKQKIYAIKSYPIFYLELELEQKWE